MSIPEGKLYNEGLREAGTVAVHHPGLYVMSFAAAGEILFGCAVAADGDKVSLPEAGNSQIAGVAGLSYQASKLDQLAYGEGDPVAVVETGIVVVKVSGDVQLGDEVRVRIDGDDKGFFCAQAEAGKTGVLSGCVWRSNAEDGKAELYVKGPFTLTLDK